MKTLKRACSLLIPLAPLAAVFTLTICGGIAFAADSTNPPPVPGTNGLAKGTNRFGTVWLFGGAKIDNPYSITVSNNTATLSSGGPSTDGYLELYGTTRYVFREGRYEDPIAADYWSMHFRETTNDGKIHTVNPFGHMPDLQGRLGFVFRGKTSPTNFTSSAIVGSGDFYLDAGGGFPLLRYLSEDRLWKQQVSLEVSGGFTTDKDFLTLHRTTFIGAGYQGRFPSANANLSGYWMGRVGAAWIDTPRLSGSSVALNNLNEPDFKSVCVVTSGAEIVFPLTSAISLQFGGNAYYGITPTPWNVTLGISLDLEKVFQGFK
jgi:hypothetical protein